MAAFLLSPFFSAIPRSQSSQLVLIPGYKDIRYWRSLVWVTRPVCSSAPHILAMRRRFGRGRLCSRYLVVVSGVVLSLPRRLGLLGFSQAPGRGVPFLV
ncbi:hypothetical protein BDZ89DRAFT_1227746 [Hymenopellis radicata]|nr:hypothetical protein BDZ89DRAFT_1227746 [Hymenopellis radicata]